MTKGYGLALANLSVKVALEEFGAKAQTAIQDELIQLFINKKALKAVPWSHIAKVAKDTSVIASHMFLREKFDATGKFEKLKARLVADGRMQDRTDFQIDDIASPTARLESIFNVIKIVVEEDRYTLVLDVGGAYLNAKIDREVFMILNRAVSEILIQALPNLKGFADKKGRVLVQIEKAMYGLVQSAKLWFDVLTGVLIKDGFTQNVLDQCVWNKGVGDQQTTVVIYVDDLLITSKCQGEINHLKNIIEKEFLEIKTKEGNEVTYLGMSLNRHSNGNMEISMKAYIKDILKEWNNYYNYAMPSDANLFYDDDESPPAKDPKKFHRVVAQLLYLSKRGRPDIALPVHYLCTRVKDPSEKDEKKLLRVLGYLNNTIERTRMITKDGNLNITAYIDAAFAAHSDGKSQSGGVIMVGSTMVEGITRKQKCATKDSTEAELVALSDLSLDVQWHSEWFESQGYKLKVPLIYQDNSSTITLVTEGGGKFRNKHMRALKAVVLDGYERKDYIIEYIKTEEMIADVLTKPLEGYKYYKFTKDMMSSDTIKAMRTQAAGVRWTSRACDPNRACQKCVMQNCPTNRTARVSHKVSARTRKYEAIANDASVSPHSGP